MSLPSSLWGWLPWGEQPIGALTPLIQTGDVVSVIASVASAGCLHGMNSGFELRRAVDLSEVASLFVSSPHLRNYLTKPFGES